MTQHMKDFALISADDIAVAPGGVLVSGMGGAIFTEDFKHWQPVLHGYNLPVAVSIPCELCKYGARFITVGYKIKENLKIRSRYVNVTSFRVGPRAFLYSDDLWNWGRWQLRPLSPVPRWIAEIMQSFEPLWGLHRNGEIYVAGNYLSGDPLSSDLSNKPRKNGVVLLSKDGGESWKAFSFLPSMVLDFGGE